jgi:hypothetical protein
MAEHAWLLEIILTVLTALIGGIGWLFRMLFTHNVNMTDKIIQMQENTTKVQTLTSQTLSDVKSSLENLKVCVDETNYYQKEIVHAIKAQAILTTKNIVVSRSTNAGDKSKKHTHSTNLRDIHTLDPTNTEDVGGDQIQDRLAHLKKAK